MGDEEYEFLDDLLDQQSELQIKCYPKIQQLSQTEQMLINTRAMIHEVVEVENELSWKHWKTATPVNEEKVKDEIVDEFIFLMNQINIIGMDANDLYYRTMVKMEVNIDRQKVGY